MKTEIIPIRIIPTNHESKEIIYADVLNYPNLLEDDFSKIDAKDYQWESRDFEAPLFANKKPN